jgi:hypothetical protein
MALLLVWAVAMAAGRPAWAGDPELVFRTIETEHFRINYHEPLGPIAQKLAVVAERARKMLAPLLKHSPRFRTEVLITDDTDSSNGSATVTPFPTVRLYLTAPDDRSELNDYDDWLFALFVHEYTHILHLDTVNGPFKWVNYLLGFGINTIYAPNQVQPRWFIEGFAVFEETERTSAGRLRSTLFDMYLRAHVLEGRFLRLDQVSNETMLWPRGNVPYLYGSAFLRYIARRYGAEVLTKISHRYGGCWSPDCWVPWGLSRTLRLYTTQELPQDKAQENPQDKPQDKPPNKPQDKPQAKDQAKDQAKGQAKDGKPARGPGFDTLYEDFHKDLEQHYRNQQQGILRSPLGLSPERALSAWQVATDRPVVVSSPAHGQEILWLEQDPYRQPALMRQDLRSGRTSTELLIDGAAGLAVSPDGQTVVMSRLNFFRQRYAFNDLVFYRRDRHSLVALTDGLRAENPAFSPDGRFIAFETQHAGTRRLGIMELPDTTEPDSERRIDPHAVLVPESWRGRAAAKVWFPLPQKVYSQTYTPAWSPDGHHIAFSYWQDGGYRDIVTLDLRTGRLKYITHDRALDMEPTYSADGEFLYFVSDRSGVFNLYAYHIKTDTTWQATNVVNGIFNPSVSADGTQLACVGFVSEGYRYEALTLDREHFILAPPALSERPEALELPDPDLSPEGRIPVQRYNPARTFFRSALSLLSLQIPTSGPGPYGQSFGFLFSTSDLVGLHSLSLSVTLNSERLDATSFSAQYNYSRLWNTLSLSFARGLSPRSGLVINGQNLTYDEEDWGASISTNLPVLQDVVRNAALSFSYQFSYSRSLTPFPATGPDAAPPQLPELGRFATLGLGFAYSDTRSYLYSVAPEAGRYLSFNAGFAHPALGSQYVVYSVRAQAIQYIGIPWPWSWAKSHTLSISYTAGIGGGDLAHRGLYYLGGFAPGGDFLRALLLGGSTASGNLRGYQPNVMYGDQLHLLSLEYQFPIIFLERGYVTLPAYLWRLHGEVYSDIGSAFFGKLSLDSFKASLGAELRLDGLLGYFLPFTLQVGYAYGFMAGAANSVYVLLNNPM